MANLQWHAMDVGEVFDRQATSSDGLGGDEVAHRLDRYGRNQVDEEPPTPGWVVLLRQFRSPLIYILLLATVVTLLLEEYVDAGVIAAVLALNALIGFVQERQAEGAVRALQQLVVPHAIVVRGGSSGEIDSRDLVPGDVVLLESGARVPADLRLVHVNGLEVDESMLTGESVPVSKSSAPVPADAPVAERSGMAYAGSVVSRGRARGVVVATGNETELGAIAGMIRSQAEGQTPLQVQMDRFARTIGLAVLLGSTVAFASGVALGGEASEMFLTAVALAVAAIPEGLPVVLTITLALGVRRMAKRNAIIRHLPAVETLGSTTVIGSDKTGTLTENRMTVQEVHTAGRSVALREGDHSPVNGEAGAERRGTGPTLGSGDPLRLTLLAGVLTNEAEVHRGDDGVLVAVGDPTEAALLDAALAAGIDPDQVREDWVVEAEIPFESERRWSAALRARDGERALFVKGAPERVLDLCSTACTPAGAGSLDRAAIDAAAEDLARRGLRVLAMAYRPDSPHAEPEDLTFLGLQGMLDPPREGVPEAIEACARAGIRVVMITGDHAATAQAIAARLGLPADQVLTGVQLDGLDDEALGRAVEQVSVFARVAPEHKLRIVHALDRLGNTVAVTGDGVNDAPALRAAAIGIAMGRDGTDVAREASDMVLTDDNFVSIQAAVEEGRVTFDNIRKVTHFLVSTGAATIVAILVSVWAGWPLLMLPAQLLWLNLVTNGLQDVALAFEPGEEGVLDRPPRRRGEGVLSRILWERTALAGVVIAIGTLVLFRWELDRSDDLTQAQTVALTTMVLFQVFHVGNSRSEHRSVLQVSPVSNPFLFIATLAAVSVHIAALYLPPTQWVLRVEPLDADAWLRMIPVAATIILAMEAHKLLRRPPGRERPAAPVRGALTGG